MTKVRVLVIVLSVFGYILFSSAIASAQVRTVLVSPVPGDPSASGTALKSALAGISSPSSTNRWLLKIEPGIYDLDSLRMRPWVDIEGSGINLTTIHSTGTTIIGANNTELRMLTIEAGDGGLFPTNLEVIGMFNDQANPRVYRVKFVTKAPSSAAAWGMRNLSSAPTIEECEFSVSGSSGSLAYGVTFNFFNSAGARSSIIRSKVAVSGGFPNYGVFMASGQTVTEIQETRIDATGGSDTYGIYALGGTWQGNEVLTLRNVVINSSGSSRSVGIFLEQGTTVGLDISNSKIGGHIAPITKGIFQGGSPAVIVQHSSILGFTKTVESVIGSISIQATALFGGPATAGIWQGCMGVWDENGVFYTNGCPQ